MLVRTAAALRVTYLVGRALVHNAITKSSATRAGPDYRMTPVGVVAYAMRMKLAAPGNEMSVVLCCEACQSVAVIDHRAGTICLVMENRKCPTVTAWRELIKRPLPTARGRSRRS